MSDIAEVRRLVAVANADLKKDGCPLRVEVRSTLAIRGTMSFDGSKPKQRRVSTGLDLRPENVYLAMDKATKIWAECTNNPLMQQIEVKGGKVRLVPDATLISNDGAWINTTNLVGRVERWAKKRGLSDSTLQKSYLPYVRIVENHLQDGDSFENACYFAVASYHHASRSRQLAKTAVKSIYEIVNAEMPKRIRLLPCTYSTSSVSFVEPLPSDFDIKQVWSSIPNKKWQNAFAVMAVFGIRNHEVFRSKLVEGNGSLLCLVGDSTKTGTRLAFPYPTSWVNDFGLHPESAFPELDESANNQRLGQQVSLQFQRYGIGFPPYHLRRAYACRCIELGNDFVVAKSLGHSVATLNDIYRKHIDPDRLMKLSARTFHCEDSHAS